MDLLEPFQGNQVERTKDDVFPWDPVLAGMSRRQMEVANDPHDDGHRRRFNASLIILRLQLLTQFRFAVPFIARVSREWQL